MAELPAQQDDGDSVAASDPPTNGAPRWVKVFGIIGLVVALMAVIVLMTGLGGPGQHGPSRHSRGMDSQSAPALVTADSRAHTTLGGGHG